MARTPAALTRILLGWALALVSCADPQSSPPADAGVPEAGPQCGPLELGAANGCQRVGVPPAECAQGFEPDDRGGCAAVLPEAPCAPGTIAVPGETECHELAPCAPGVWGNAPEQPGVEHVDASYAGGDGDGSAAKPWTTIQAGIDAASSGGVVAVAAGSYSEDVVIADAPVRLWGRCASTVEIVGTGVAPAALLVLGANANGTEVHDIAVRGAAIGIAAAGAKDVLLEHAWVHDTESRGLDLTSENTTGSVRVAGSLIERTHELGAFVIGADVLFESSSVRDTGASSADTGGAGIFVRWSTGPALRGRVTVRSSIVERNLGAGVVAFGADAELEATVVRDTGPEVGTQIDGEGVIAAYDPSRTARGGLTLRASVVERNLLAGVVLKGSDGALDAVTVRATGAQVSDGVGGIGLVVEPGEGGQKATASVARSLVADSRGMGIFVADSDITLDASLVSAVLPREVDALYGDALLGISYDTEATAVVTGSRIERGARAGISSFGANVQIGGSLLDCNGIALDGELFNDRAFSFQDLGANDCGCSSLSEGAAASGPCQVLSTDLAPPPPLVQ